MKITRDILIEDLVHVLPASVRYLSEKGLTCIACGEPVWGTLAELAKSKGFDDVEIDSIAKDLNRLSRS